MMKHVYGILAFFLDSIHEASQPAESDEYADLKDSCYFYNSETICFFLSHKAFICQDVCMAAYFKQKLANSESGTSSQNQNLQDVKVKQHEYSCS